MGLASLILGILSLLISFTIFQDLAIILGVLALVLGILAIAKKKNRGLGIAGVVLAVIAGVLIFSPLNFTQDENHDIVSDNGNILSQVEVTTENIDIRQIGITEFGDLVIEVTNNNDGHVCISNVNTIFKDENGNFVKKVQSAQSFICIPAHSSTLVYDSAYEGDFSNYATCEFSCELANISESFLYGNLEIKASNTGEQIAVTVTNNNNEAIDSCELIAAFYRDEKLVAISEGSSSDVVSKGENAYININYPYDKDYENIDFDTYKVYFVQASKDET